MNLIFILAVTGLILIALALVLPPIWRNRPVESDDLDQRNIEIARQRLVELKANRQAGGISQEQFDEQVDELELSLHDDLSLTKPVATGSWEGRWLVYLLALIIPLSSIALYSVLGNFQAVAHSQEMAVAPTANPTAEQILKMVEGLAERMKSEPDNAEGWLMLGKSYKYMMQFDKAAKAFAQAYRLLGDKADVMLLYAEALAFANQKNMAGKPSDLIFKALAQEPNNPNGLWLGGLAKIQQGDKAAALTLWHKLEILLPADSDTRQEVRNIIASVSGENAPADIQSGRPEKSATASVTVAVSLAPELKSSVDPNDTVFIYAQAPSGPKMPLAIVRKQVTDLPLEVTLNDKQAMTPAMKLSNFGSVKLLARVAKSGQAASQPGDLIGTLDNVDLSDSSVRNILINERVQ